MAWKYLGENLHIGEGCEATGFTLPGPQAGGPVTGDRRMDLALICIKAPSDLKRPPTRTGGCVGVDLRATVPSAIGLKT